MALYPDLVACGITYIRLSFHVAGGLEPIDHFWERHGLDRSKERFLWTRYSRRGESHTVWLQWSRAHETCSDVFLGLEARKPSEIWPRRPLAKARLREVDFRDFIDLLRKLNLPHGLRARYAFPWDKSLDSMIRLPPQVRPRSLSLDVFDEANRYVMNVTYERMRDLWLTVVMPTGIFSIRDEPVTDSFFKVPYDTACLLAKSLRQERLEPI